MPVLPSAEELYSLLLKEYGKPSWWSDDPFTVIVQSVLVQNTSWSSVLRTSSAAGRMTPESVLSMRPEELEELIRPCGFCKRKAETVRSLAAWYKEYLRQKDLPSNEIRSELLSIRGVGEETADVILVYALYRPAVIIDAYTRRFMRRLGYDFPSDDGIRTFFRNGLPDDVHILGYLHWLLLEHSINSCRKKPECNGCPFLSVCQFAK